MAKKHNSVTVANQRRIEKEKRSLFQHRIAIVSLAVTILGSVGLITLPPKFLVTALEPLSPDQPLSVPFRIENAGAFPSHTYMLRASLWI